MSIDARAAGESMALSCAMPARGTPDALAGNGDDVCERAANGSPEAILALYDAHQAYVLTFTERLIGDRALAEDLTHEVFLALPQALKRFRGECSIRSYLVSIAARRAHRQIRAAVRRRAMQSRLAREPLASPTPPDVQTERAELAELLNRALDALPVDQRVAFVLCEVEERSSVEVSAMLGEKDATIRARVFHAKKKLRNELSTLMAGKRGGA